MTTDYWNLALAESPDLQGEPFCPGWLPMLGTVWDPAMFDYYHGKMQLRRVCFKGELRRYASGTARSRGVVNWRG